MTKVWLKFYALIPSEREKPCPHHLKAYSGSVPCTGPIICAMCGARFKALDDKQPEEV